MSADSPSSSSPKPERFRLVSDDDGHDYIIPAENRRAFYEWLDSQDAQDGITPPWAERLNTSPNNISFTDWREDR